MFHLFEMMLKSLDRVTEQSARKAARQMGRRHMLAKTGALLAGSAFLPALPFYRGTGLAQAAEPATGIVPTQCTYWRYCALDGALCSTSGGTMTSCPPGSEASKVAWVGTCRNPEDGKNYLISYNDCCGKAMLPNALSCLNSERERPGYRMGLHNDINWCVANTNKGYHCTVTVAVGLADE
ncbi:amine dehydrogenase [Duganella sp. FT80W]|uniref:Amine dehydrogenase n=1 Tax=Duganella guangzhouensis TaxID=2666084 RepID=A0A6I2KUT7_9BURK|nr:methylamine dehydrogenase light chain [Duganella guangzhouensis]MRW89232.1 amine dehydrogenase [Duganella guangzhouensis]